MKWIDFICIAEEQGLKSDDEIDSIEMIRKRFDICYTEQESGYSGVIEVAEEDNK